MIVIKGKIPSSNDAFVYPGEPIMGSKPVDELLYYIVWSVYNSLKLTSYSPDVCTPTHSFRFIIVVTENYSDMRCQQLQGAENKCIRHNIVKLRKV